MTVAMNDCDSEGVYQYRCHYKYEYEYEYENEAQGRFEAERAEV